MHDDPVWHNTLTSERRYASDSLATHYRIIDICYANLCQQLGVAYENLGFRLSVQEVTGLTPNVPMHTNGQVARAIASHIETEGASQQDLERIQKALNHVLTTAEITRLSQGDSSPGLP